jgi:hypothetical protein
MVQESRKLSEGRSLAGVNGRADLIIARNFKGLDHEGKTQHSYREFEGSSEAPAGFTSQ